MIEMLRVACIAFVLSAAISADYQWRVAKGWEKHFLGWIETALLMLCVYLVRHWG